MFLPSTTFVAFSYFENLWSGLSLYHILMNQNLGTSRIVSTPSSNFSEAWLGITIFDNMSN
ncbi:MAG: hypothetical protein EPN85_15230 [Bacteroidetes bacterium]|nr:MAG: hypothetical protein EPN85_15230 [Bacteroidota bacterium]